MKAKFAYVGIRVKDLEKSIDFYTKILGMKFEGRTKIEQTKGVTVGLKSDGFTLELNHYSNESPYYKEYVVGEGLDHLAFSVDDLDGALGEAQAAGYRIISEIQASDSRWAYVEDPNGIWIELFQQSSLP